MKSDRTHPVQNNIRVLVIDDEKNIRTTLSLCLERAGCEVTAVSSADSALTALTQQSYDIALVDLRIGDSNGLELIPKLLAEGFNLSVIVMTAYATIDTAVEAIKRGAKDYIAKPFTPAQIEHVVKQTREQRELAYRIANLEEQLRGAVPEIELQTHSPKMRAVLETALRSAQADATILLRGESGTGKGVLARLIHFRSPRAAQPFVVVNCPTLSEERPALLGVARHEAVHISLRRRNREDRHHFYEIRQRSSSLERMSAVDVEESTAICAELFDRYLRCRRSHRDSLLRSFQGCQLDIG
jgi:DNA-binding NtrC family response regulator